MSKPRNPMTAREVSEHAMNGELNPSLSAVLTEREGFCFQFLGMDTDDRAVFYASDDGSLVRYRYVPEDHELQQDASRIIGPELDSDSGRVDPFLTAFIHLTERGEKWAWVHPRFRWAKEELSEMQGYDG